MQPEKWTPEQKNEVRRQWCVERLSASQIAAGYGVTRNAIIGLVHRMGLDGFRGANAEEIAAIQAKRRQNERARQNSKNARMRKGDVAPMFAMEKAPSSRVAEPAVAMLNIPFRGRRHDQCSWIPGEPGADAVCCGLAVKDGTSWCSHHHAMIYVPRALRVVASNNRPNRTTTRYGALRVA